MTYSHEQPKGWGFSRRTPNLNLSAKRKHGETRLDELKQLEKRLEL